MNKLHEMINERNKKERKCVMTSKPLNAIIIISIAIIRGVVMAAKSTKSKTTGKRRIRQQKSRLRIKNNKKNNEKQPEKEKLPAGNQPETVIVF